MKTNAIRLYGLLILIALFSICTSQAQTVKDKNPILLLHAESTSLVMLIDKMENLEDAVVIIKNGASKWNYELSDKGRYYRFENLNPSAGGWVMLKKNNHVLLSISLSQFINSPLVLLESRYAKMKPNDIAKGYIVDPDGEDDGPLINQDVAQGTKRDAVVNDNYEFDPSREKNVIDSDQEDTQTSELKEDDFMVSEQVQEEVKEEKEPAKTKEEIAAAQALMPESFLTPYEIVFLHDETFAEQKPFMQVSSRKDLNEELLETAQFMEAEYTINDNYGSWLMVEDHKGREFAFTGSKLISFDPESFMLKFEEPEEIKSFLLLNQIAFIPESKKWIGIYCQNHYLGAVRCDREYKLALNGPNVLMIESPKNNYSIIIGSQNCTVVYDNGKKTKSYPIGKHRGHFSPRNWNISESVLTNY